MRKLGFAKIGAFDLPTHGQFFWNFRTELEERWDFQRAVSNGWLPSKDDWENHLDSILQEIESTCNLTASDIYPIPYSTSHWSTGLITVTVISIVLMILLVCAIASVFCKVAERSDSCWFNFMHTIQAQLLGYSPIETSETHTLPSALEMNRATR